MTQISDPAREQIERAYRCMACEAAYRPAAPSDGYGTITVPPDKLDLNAEARTYAERWWEQEDAGAFTLGSTRPDAANDVSARSTA